MVSDGLIRGYFRLVRSDQRSLPAGTSTWVMIKHGTWVWECKSWSLTKLGAHKRTGSKFFICSRCKFGATIVNVFLCKNSTWKFLCYYFWNILSIWLHAWLDFFSLGFLIFAWLKLAILEIKCVAKKYSLDYRIANYNEQITELLKLQCITSKFTAWTRH